MLKTAARGHELWYNCIHYNQMTVLIRWDALTFVHTAFML